MKIPSTLTSTTIAAKAFCDKRYALVESTGLAFLVQNAFTAPRARDYVQDLFQREPTLAQDRVKGKLACVTGVSADSIGYHIAEELAVSAKMDVCLVGRSRSKLDQAERSIQQAAKLRNVVPGPKIFKVLMDLNDLTSIPLAAKEVLDIAAKDEYGGTLSVLINSAGVHDVTYEATAQGMDPNAGRNLVSNILWTQSLLPLLGKGGGSSRVVMVATVGHCAGRQFSPDRFLEHPATGGAPDGIHVKDKKDGKLKYAKSMSGTDLYHQSKMGLIAATQALAKKNPNVLMTCVHPGSVLSGFGRKLGLVGAIYYNLFYPFQFSASQGAVSSLRAALDPTLCNINGGSTGGDFLYLHCDGAPWTVCDTRAIDPDTHEPYEMSTYSERCLDVVNQLIAKHVK